MLMVWNSDIFRNAILISLLPQTSSDSSQEIHAVLSQQNLNDYFWANLKLVNPFNRKLEDLQTQILNLGPDYFNPDDKQPMIYFRVLVNSNLFSQAVEYLKNYNEFWVQLVHFVIALSSNGIL